MFHHNIPQNYDRFLCFGVVVFSDYLFVSDLEFLLSVLFGRYFSISLDFSTVKSTLDVFITDVFKSVLFVVSVLCECFCFTNVAFSFVIFFLSCGLITGACITSLFFESWFVNECMILSLFLSCSLRNDICSSSWFINLYDISLVQFLFTCSLGLCLTHDCKNSFFKLLSSVKNELFILLNSSKSFSLRFPISSI